MHLDLSGRVAIVTGGGRGIGREIARTFAREGVTVVIMDFRQELLDEVTAEWQREGWQGLQINGDVRQKGDCQDVVAAADKEFGRIP